MYQVQDGEGKPHYTFDICNCDYSSVFNQSERHTLTAETLTEKHQQQQMQEGNKMKIDNSSNYLHSCLWK